ncbi:MAG: 3'-_5' exoribonuclease Bsu YhaM, partial [uncultured Rubrobacteraceae bacterium]
SRTTSTPARRCTSNLPRTSAPAAGATTRTPSTAPSTSRAN